MKTLFALALCSGLAGCEDLSISRQNKLAPYDPSSIWSDGTSERSPPAGTMARGDLALDNDAANPPPATPTFLARGRERYDIFCTPCHGLNGNGDGVVVKRGFPQPPSLSLARLRDAPSQHFFDVITNGVGVMYPFDLRISPRDRWAIVAYVRALQLAASAPIAFAPEATKDLQ